MKKKIKTYRNGEMVEIETNYIPLRYITSILIMLAETLSVLAVVILMTIYVPYFYIAVFITQFACAVSIIASKDNPDYKIPWLVVVLALPVVGFMIYFMFYSRQLSKRYIKRYKLVEDIEIKDSSKTFKQLNSVDQRAYAKAYELSKMSNSNLYQNTVIKYYPSGESYFDALLIDLAKAKTFIFMEYFIIEEGEFWNSILNILKFKARKGIDVKVIYDDIGCMTTLPGKYYKTLASYGIDAIPFSILRGQANSEFNNRSHRKITVIDNMVAYTGGINIADEYINQVEKYGHWKDVGIRLEGEAVSELTKLFLSDFVTNYRKPNLNFDNYFMNHSVENDSFIVPFGDGPSPIYKHRVAKTLLLNMLYQAKDYVYMTSPYVIIDNELVQAIENTAMRGVKIKLIVPHIPDKKLIFTMTKKNYENFIKAGVEIYEYEPGFIHAKTYISDDLYAMVGTVNLDYRSLVHHFENGVWVYRDDVVLDIKKDFEDTLDLSLKVNIEDLKSSMITRLIQSLVSLFMPLL